MEDLNIQFKTKPYEHQLKVLQESLLKPSWAYFMEMGTGKSWIVINRLAELFVRKEIDAAVIVAKKGEYMLWPRDQLPDHMPIEYHAMPYLGKAFTTQEWKMMEVAIKAGKLPILIINIESLNYSGKDILKKFYSRFKQVFLAVDESTCVKNHKAGRSKELYKFAAISKYRAIMTGSGVTQAPMDLYGQCAGVLGSQTLGFNNFFAFRNTYCNMVVQHFGSRAVNAPNPKDPYRDLDKLAKRVSTFSHQILKKDCLDLPPKIFTKRYIEMTPEQKRLYTTLRDEAIAEVGGEIIDVNNALALMTKLHQIACGQLKLGEDSYASIPNNRIAELIDICEEYEGKIIIWATYRQTIKDIIKNLEEKFGKDSVAPYWGGVDPRDREKSIEAFRKGNARFFVSNPQVGGFGTTLVEASLAIYYSNGFNLEHRLQSEDRCHRIGQTVPVNYIDFVTLGTVDVRVVDVLRNKKKMADVIMSRPFHDWI